MLSRCCRGIAFEDLDADEAHSRFKKFVEKWNKGALDAMYYTYVVQGTLLKKSVLDVVCGGRGVRHTHTLPQVV